MFQGQDKIKKRWESTEIGMQERQMSCVLSDDKKRPFDNSHHREQPNNANCMHEHRIAHNEKNQPSYGPNTCLKANIHMNGAVSNKLINPSVPNEE